MLRVLIVSHSPASTTGYGRVVRALAGKLTAAAHQVLCLGAGTQEHGQTLPYPLRPWNGTTGRPIAEALASHCPDVLLTIGDPWMFESVPSMAERRLTKWLAYFPVDGYPLPPQWARWVAAVDVPVVFSRFAQDLVRAGTGTAPALIHHGVSTATFRPGDRHRAKELARTAGHFTVGTVARNQVRKNIPALVKAFARFARDKDDALLYLHTQLRGEYDIAELVRHHGVEGKTRVTDDLGADRGVPDELLATVYRAMDVFVLPTMAEGFGLPIIEAQACGTPALVTDFSACPELVPDLFQRLRVKDTLTMGRNFEQAIVDVDDIVEKLDVLYRDRERLRLLGQRCHRFAQAFEWSIAYEKFDRLLASLPFQVPAATPSSCVPSVVSASPATPIAAGSSTPPQLDESNARAALDRLVAALRPYPGGFEGRGIVIVGGGLRYFPCAWVCIRMLRQCGCRLPVELWHLGPEEMTADMAAIVAPHGVACVDGEIVAKQNGSHTLGGWELKPLAILHSRFREVLLLDADNFPLVDPEFLFQGEPYRECGAVFWPDFGKLGRGDRIWELTGVAYRDEPAFESGQVLVDKQRCWQALTVTTWFNQNAGFWYRYLLGDKDTFHLAWRRVNAPYAMVPRPAKDLQYAMAQHDFEGRRILQHRNRAKWMLSGWNTRMADFEREGDGFRFLDELRQRWNPPATDYDRSATQQLQSAWRRFNTKGNITVLPVPIGPTAPAVWQMIGRVAEHTARCVDDCHTLHLVRRAIEVAPAVAELRAILGTTLGSFGRHREALEAFEVAVRLAPDLRGVRSNLTLASAAVAAVR